MKKRILNSTGVKDALNHQAAQGPTKNMSNQVQLKFLRTRELLVVSRNQNTSLSFKMFSESTGKLIFLNTVPIGLMFECSSCYSLQL